MRVIGYCRVSTADQEYGIEAQRTKILTEADARGWDVEWIEDQGKSGKDIDRPGMRDALAMLKNKQADVLVVAKLDRLSRSLKDFAGLMETAEKQGWAIIALDFGLDMTTPTGEMVANIIAAVSRYERRLIGLRTQEALAEVAKTKRLGAPVLIDARVQADILRLHAEGASLRQIAEALNSSGTQPAGGGKRWYASTIKSVLDRLRPFSLGCVLLDADQWPDAFDQLLNFRRRLRSTYGLPMRAEIKANYLLRNNGPFRKLGLGPSGRRLIYRAHMRVVEDLPARAFAPLQG